LADADALLGLLLLAATDGRLPHGLLLLLLLLGVLLLAGELLLATGGCRGQACREDTCYRGMHTMSHVVYALKSANVSEMWLQLQLHPIAV
jgi:hypothetical protein